MSVIDSDVLGGAQVFQKGGKGPVTAARHRRNALVYAGLAIAAFLPAVFDAPAAWQAASSSSGRSWVARNSSFCCRKPTCRRHNRRPRNCAG